LDLIASGPTVSDTSTSYDAWQLVQQLPMLWQESPPPVLKILQTRAEDDDETVPPHVFESTINVVVGNNELAVQAATKEARHLGYHPIVLGSRFEREVQTVAEVLVAAQHICTDGDTYRMARRPAALIAGVETTVTRPPNHTGKGGRNQELALAAALKLHELQLHNEVVASVGTDGTDGPTDAAGAVVDIGTLDRMPGSAKEALHQHNAYSYLREFEQSDGKHSPLIKTGSTGTNVADVIVALIR